ncbi:MAG: prepilin-type N-terminal cleavage/methylation domain-containing protein [Sulfuritalea sp.]|nr:prepilin-type N-terminal cleavage/methylation domain-containing protein [Sulfuritalea sp.]
MTRVSTYRPSGFTLIELAMVLFIVSLLIGGLLLPLSTSRACRPPGHRQGARQHSRSADRLCRGQWTPALPGGGEHTHGYRGKRAGRGQGSHHAGWCERSLRL